MFACAGAQCSAEAVDRKFFKPERGAIVVSVTLPSNGDLSAIGFPHPAEGSALIDGSGDVGPPYRDARPDIGAFER